MTSLLHNCKFHGGCDKLKKGAKTMEFLHYFKSRQGEIIRLLKQLVTLESPTQDKEAVNKCTQFCAAELKKAGLKVTRHSQEESGDFITAEMHIPQEEAHSKSYLILTHADTVWPVGQIEKMPFYVQDQKIFGPGVLDMKAGLAMVLSVFRTFHQLNLASKKRITLFINSTEEAGSQNADKMLEKLAKSSSAAFCLEPAVPGGALKLQRKGRLVMQLETRGKAAHAGSPEKGVNAIEELLYQLQKVRRLRTKEATINIGVIQGGTKPNVVAEQASVLLDFRFWDAERKDKIHSFLKNLEPHFKGAHIKSIPLSYKPPMEKTPASARLFQEVKDLAQSMGITLAAGKTGGGSDASVIASRGVPTLDGLGPDGDGIHAAHEHLLLPSLIERTALLASMLLA